MEGLQQAQPIRLDNNVQNANNQQNVQHAQANNGAPMAQPMFPAHDPNNQPQPNPFIRMGNVQPAQQQQQHARDQVNFGQSPQNVQPITFTEDQEELILQYFEVLKPEIEQTKKDFTALCKNVIKKTNAVKKLEEAVKNNTIPKGLKFQMHLSLAKESKEQQAVINNGIKAFNTQLVNKVLGARKHELQTSIDAMNTFKNTYLDKCPKLLKGCPEIDIKLVGTALRIQLSRDLKEIEIRQQINANRKA
jgi:hypothetical protein